MTDKSQRPAVAVVALGALFPGSQGVEGFWRGIAGARDALAEVPPSHWRIGDYYDPDPKAVDRIYARRGAFLDGAAIDVARLGIPPKTLASTDSAQLLALVVAEELLADGRARFGDLPRERMSVILGVASTTALCAHMASRMQRPAWVEGMRRAGLPEDVIETACEAIASQFTPWDENVFPGLLGNVVAGRIANRFDLGGSNFVTDAACASSLSAVSMGLNELYLGDSDAVITGGVDCLNDILMYTCFSKTGALSPSDDCRPFAEGADGTALGEGLGMLMLRRLEDAERDGNHVYAVIRGCGASSDGRARSIYAPRASGQEQALRRAYAAAGYSPATVELVEAHGTGTAAGDRAEVEALRAVFEEEAGDRRRWCALGSIKSQLGHTKAAAGAAGLIKSVLAVHAGVLPPTLKVERPSAELGLEASAFYVNARTRPWVRGGEHPRRAAVSAFGFGGSNFHVTVEEYRGGARAPRFDALARGVVLLAARDLAGLAERARALAGLTAPGALAFEAWQGQHHADSSLPARAAIVSEDEAGVARGAAVLAERLAGDALPGDGALAPGVHACLGAEPGRVAFLFPGQGSQYPDMGAGLACRSRLALDTWDEAETLLALAPRLHTVVFPPPAFDPASEAAQAAQLRATEWAQPAIAVASVALLRVLEACGVRADAVAGHSFGELVALHAAGAIGFEDLLAAARRRGELMASAGALARGAMLALSGEPADLDGALAALPEGVVLANHNSPRQRVLSGDAAAIERVAAGLGSRLKASRLDVSTAFHSPLMNPARSAFEEFLGAIEPAAPGLPVHGCADGQPMPGEAPALRERLARQLVEPVRFAEQVEALYAAGVRSFVEVGPGQVLSRLAGECLAGRPHRAVSLDRRGADAATALAEGLARLWVAGVPVDWAATWRGVRAPLDPAAREAPRHAVTVTGVHPGKPPPGETPARSNAGAPHDGGATGEVPASAPFPGGGALPRVAPPAGDIAPAPAPAPAPASAASAAPVAGVYDEDAARRAEEHAARLSQVQMAFQRSMLDAHLAFLRAIGDATGTTEGAVAAAGDRLAGSGAATAAMPPRRGEAEMPVATADAGMVPPPLADAGAASPPHEPAPMMPPPQAEAGWMASPPASAAAPPPGGGAPAPSSAPARPAAGAAPPADSGQRDGGAEAVAAADLEQMLIEVVAESTGYPVEVIALDADLEGDLGVDSIKRVEILAAFQERAPGLPEIDAGTLGAQRTLGDILALMRRDSALAPADGGADGAGSGPADTPAEAGDAVVVPAVAAVAAAASAAPRPVPEPTLATPDDADAGALLAGLIEVVAESTGYPVEVIDPGADLEGDLGIDSIKRVEILAAVAERFPHLPEPDTAHLGALRTLGEIVDCLAGSSAAAGAAPRPVLVASHGTPARDAAAPIAQAVRVATVALESAPRAAGDGGRWRSCRRVAVSGEGVLAAAVAARLREAGIAAEPAGETAGEADGLVCLDALGASGVAPALAAATRVFARVKAAAGGLENGCLVTVQDTGGSFAMERCGVEEAWSGGVPGLVKCVAAQWPGCLARAIDLERGGRPVDVLARAIADEIVRGDGTEIALSADGGRRTPAIRMADPELRVDPPFEAGAVVIASGGGRGVTAICLEALAARVPLRLALLGRTGPAPEDDVAAGEDAAAVMQALHLRALAAGRHPTPAELRDEAGQLLASREVAATIARLEALGCEVAHFPVDVSDAAAAAAAVARVRERFGPIAGLVHGAGVIADARIEDKSEACFEHVVTTKAGGFANLLQATAGDPLRAIVAFSSVSARHGNAGQADYALANEILNRVCHAEARRRGEACLVRALNWGPWDGGMVTPALARHFERQGIALLEPAAGAALFLSALGGAAGEVEWLLTADAGSRSVARSAG